MLFDLSEIALDDRVQAMLAEMETLRPDRLVLDTLAALRIYSDQSFHLSAPCRAVPQQGH